MAVVGVLLFLLILQLVFSRLFLWALKRMGDTARRIYGAHAISFVTVVGVLATATAGEGSPRIVEQIVMNLPALLVLSTIDILRLLRRRAKMRDAIAVARMR